MLTALKTFFKIPGTLKSVLWALAIGASVGGGAATWLTMKLYQAAEVKELKSQIETMRGYQAAAAEAERAKSEIEAKYLAQSQEIEDLRRSDASVNSYLATPIPASLQRLLNAK